MLKTLAFLLYLQMMGSIVSIDVHPSGGIGECARCNCFNDVAKCDLTRCQSIGSTVKPDAFILNTNTAASIDYSNIKDQIAKKFFAGYDPQQLKILTDTIGCQSSDCPQLLAACEIDYVIVAESGKQYVGRGDKINKIVIHSTDVEQINRSPSRQVVQTIPYELSVIQKSEVVITKTKQTTSNQKDINYCVYKRKESVTFTQQEVERRTETNVTTIYFPSQNITVDPFTKMNVTLNFFQYDDINEYFLNFEIDQNSTFSYPSVDANSNLILIKSQLGDFLQKNREFVSGLKYEHDDMLQLRAVGDKYVLQNFPTIERITNFGVDVLFGTAKEIQT